MNMINGSIGGSVERGLKRHFYTNHVITSRDLGSTLTLALSHCCIFE